MQIGHVLLKIAQGHNGFLTFLNFVDKQQRFVGYNRCAAHSSQLWNDTFYVEILFEQLDIAGLFFEVYLHEVFEHLAQMPYSR